MQHAAFLEILTAYLFLAITLVAEIRGREPIKPTADVAEIVKDLTGLHLTHDVAGTTAPCLLDVQRDLTKPNQGQPLYLRPNSADYWLPNASGQLEIPQGASIELHCNGAGFTNVSDAKSISLPKRTHTVLARCLADKTFEWQGGKYEFRQFVCAQPPKFVVEPLAVTCADDGTLYRIGYNVSGQRFVETMQVCHTQEMLRTHYVRHRLQPASVHYQTHVKRVNFQQLGYFRPYNMKELYTQQQQRRQIVKLLGLEAAGGVNATAYISSSSSLSRGHLAAKADLIYASQQRTTFTYFNVAPQWQSFNGGQWVALEHETRKFVQRAGLDVDVYTGTFGVLTLRQGHELYLTQDENNNGLLPVPKLFYRVIVERKQQQQQRGVAIVGVNNPFATQAEIDAEYIICDDVREQVPWLQRWLLNKSLKKGYMYACTVSDLAQAVGHLPKELANIEALLM